MLARYIVITVVTMLMNLLPAYALAFTWGVCGHVWRNQLWNDPETQFSLMERYGLTTYRFDLNLTDDNPHIITKLQTLLVSAQRHHITLHPILHIPFSWNNNITDNGKYPPTAAGLEAQGYRRVYPLVRHFASDIQDWELENELNLRKGIKKGIGHNASDFETPLAYQWATALKGMSRAIRDVANETQTSHRIVIDTTYVDFGFIPFLERNGVSVDKLAYHYYYNGVTSPYRISAPDKIEDIFLEMKKLGKPVIINEFNAAEVYAPKNEHKPYDDGAAILSLKKHTEYIMHQTEAPIEGIEFYELYNEPGKDVAESNFGLMDDAVHPRAQMLLAAVYACGRLTSQEQQQLLSHGVFSASTLAEQLNRCGHLH